MTTVSAKFNVSDYELYGTIDPYLSASQISTVQQVGERVNAQLDWLAQLLGWSGNEYWFNLVSNIDQKRQLLGGTFGVFNGYLIPTVKEIRNWDNTIILDYLGGVSSGQNLILGEYSYLIEKVSKVEETLVVSIGELTDQFLTDFAAGGQIKIDARGIKPFPFERPGPGISADASFLVKLIDSSPNTLTLYPSFDNTYSLPYSFNVFYAGSRLFFDKPVQLTISEDSTILPSYNEDKKLWFLDIPAGLTGDEPSVTTHLMYDSYIAEFLILPWVFQSDWGCRSVLDNYTGVWGNKGGFLPYNFVFDSLSLHGFDEEKSLFLVPLEREIPFNELLNFVYYQKTTVSPDPPQVKKGQTWWNSQTGSFSVFEGDHYNCGPWVEINYPDPPEDYVIPDYVFPDYSSFSSYTGSFLDGQVIRIIDASGLSEADDVIGLTGQIVGPCQVNIFKVQDSEYWGVNLMVYPDVDSFKVDAPKLPPRVIVKVEDSTNLQPVDSYYTVDNLYTTINNPYPVLLSRWDGEPKSPWYISPPSQLKYIGNTRLFGESPQDGELSWDYSNPDEQNRVASVFYYNRWEFVVDHWELEGDWVDVSTGETTTPPSPIVDYGVVKVFCDGILLSSGTPYQTYDYQISYTVNPSTGIFAFSYNAITFEGTIKYPKIEVTDSLTTTYRYDITKLVFSGLQLYMSPNVRDSSTSLRVWKTKPMYVASSESDLSIYENVLTADTNTGPCDQNWERYFLRLPPSYQRDGAEWQKVNLICKDFGLWGTSISPELMDCPAKNDAPAIYEEVYLTGKNPNDSAYIYAEPYLYSNIFYGNGTDEDYLNAAILPGFDIPYDDYSVAKVVEYDPLHNRRADVDADSLNFGEWQGSYFRVAECKELSGFLDRDIKDQTVNSIDPPIWDTSIYKLPTTCVIDEESSKVDANHYKIGYAYFAADLSAAGDAVFDPFSPPSWRKCTGRTSLYLTGCSDCPT